MDIVEKRDEFPDFLLVCLLCVYHLGNSFYAFQVVITRVEAEVLLLEYYYADEGLASDKQPATTERRASYQGIVYLVGADESETPLVVGRLL